MKQIVCLLVKNKEKDKTMAKKTIEIINNCASCIRSKEHENNLHCTTMMKDEKVFDKSSIVVTKKNCSFFKGIK